MPLPHVTVSSAPEVAPFRSMKYYSTGFLRFSTLDRGSHLSLSVIRVSALCMQDLEQARSRKGGREETNERT